MNKGLTEIVLSDFLLREHGCSVSKPNSLAPFVEDQLSTDLHKVGTISFEDQLSTDLHRVGAISLSFQPLKSVRLLEGVRCREGTYIHCCKYHGKPRRDRG